MGCKYVQITKAITLYYDKIGESFFNSYRKNCIRLHRCRKITLGYTSMQQVWEPDFKASINGIMLAKNNISYPLKVISGIMGVSIM